MLQNESKLVPRNWTLDPIYSEPYYGAFTLDVKYVLNENLGDILGGMQC